MKHTVKGFTLSFTTIFKDVVLQRGVVSGSVVSDSLRPHGLWPARFLSIWILSARILERFAMPSFRGSSQPGDLPDPGTEARSPPLQALPSEPPGKTLWGVGPVIIFKLFFILQTERRNTKG